MSSHDSGQALLTVWDLNITANPQTVRNSIEPFELNNFYQFTLSSRSSFQMSLSGMSANADVQLIDSSGQFLQRSANQGINNEVINAILEPDNYYLLVYSYDSASTNYDLTVSAIPESNNSGNTGSNSSIDPITGNPDNTDLNNNSNTFTGGISNTDSNNNPDPITGNPDNTNSNNNTNTSTGGTGSTGSNNNINTSTGGTGSTGSNNNTNTSTGGTDNTDSNNNPDLITGNPGNTDSNNNTNTSTEGTGSTSSNNNTNNSTGGTDNTDSNNNPDLITGNPGNTDSNNNTNTSTGGIENTGSNNNPDLITGNPGNTDSNNNTNTSTDGIENTGSNNSQNPSPTTPEQPANLNPSFNTFSVSDASSDTTLNTIFKDGALSLSYNLANTSSVSSIRLEALKNGTVVSNLGAWSTTNLSNHLINLADFSSLTGGNYQFRAVATTTSGQEFFSNSQAASILSWSQNNGTFAADTFNYSAELGTGAVFLGRGGTDKINFTNISSSDITSINGLNLSAFNPLSGSTTNQAIFKGTAFDYLTLADGREIYFQGIEKLSFSNGTNLDLQVRPNDTNFGSQWNLHISDVESAWRFTQGANNVLLASLDTGILTASGASGGIVDISTNRLITDATDDDNQDDDGKPANGTTTYGHGHSGINIMAATANNSSGIAGINWNSSVYVNDIYQGVSLQKAIQDTINYARANNKRVVFQGGIQGEYWLQYSGGTQAQLEQLIAANSDIAAFAIAAGNGGGSLNDPNYLTSVSGVAKLETTHSNVMSVGALQAKAEVNGSLQWQVQWIDGFLNATTVNLASYSNRGSNLTLVAATDSPAMDKYGNMTYFGGTSASNPNLAGIASLVWSVNPNLNGGQVRQVLIDTAMDLGSTGKDNTFGNGLVNADAAVRRSWALQHNSTLANLYSGGSLLV